MKTDLNPKYIESFISRLQKISVQSRAIEVQGGTDYNGPPPTAMFSIGDMRNVRSFTTNELDRRSSIGRPNGTDELVVEGNEFVALQKISSELIGRCELEEVVSSEFVENVLADYRFSKLNSSEAESPILFLAQRVSEAVQECTYSFPLSGSSGNVEFFFCGVEFQAKAKSYEQCLEAFRGSAAEDEERRLAWERQSEEWTEKYGRCMWASVTLVAEPTYAKEVALRRTREATHLLRAICVNGYHPTRHVGLVPGAPFSESFLMTKFTEGRAGFSESSMSKYELLWFSDSFLAELGQLGFKNIDLLYRKESKTEFEEVCLRALSIVGSVVGMQDVSDKVVYGCTALDLLFTRGPNEPILATMPRRLAMQIGADLTERKSIVDTVRFVYGLRSGRVHGGRQAESSRQTLDFFRYLFYLAGQLVFIASSHPTHEAYLNSLEDRLLSD